MAKVATLSKKRKLSKQEKKFIEIKTETGNGTLAAKKAFNIKNANSAGVKAYELLRNPNIINAIEKALPDDLLAQVHSEGLNAKKGKYPDYAVRHKYLDSAYKVKGSYAPEKSVHLNVLLETEQRNKILGITSKVLEEMTHEEVNG